MPARPETEYDADGLKKFSKDGRKAMKRPTGVTLIADSDVGVAGDSGARLFRFVLHCIDGHHRCSFSRCGLRCDHRHGNRGRIFAADSGGSGRGPGGWRCSICRNGRGARPMATIGVGTALTVISLFALRRYVLIPVGPSLVCHLFVVATAIWMLAYLSRPE